MHQSQLQYSDECSSYYYNVSVIALLPYPETVYCNPAHPEYKGILQYLNQLTT